MPLITSFKKLYGRDRRFRLFAILLFVAVLAFAWPMLGFGLFMLPLFGAAIERTDAAALIPEEVSREIIKNAPEKSAVLQLARRLPNMSRNQSRMPVLAALATAGFVNGDTGLKPTTKLMWDNKFINAEELAVIVPIAENVLDDQDYDMWGEVRPEIERAIGEAIDAAILFGVNSPANWPDDLLTGATAAGNTVPDTTGTDIYDAIMGEGGVLAVVEQDGYLPTGHVAALAMRAKLRGLRDLNLQPIFTKDMQNANRYNLDGLPMFFPRNGSFDAASALMFSGDWEQLVYSIRRDLTWKLATEGVIQDAAGEVIYNLFQQDMVAMRVVLRLGWQLPNPINAVQAVEADRYPFSVLTPP